MSQRVFYNILIAVTLFCISTSLLWPRDLDTKHHNTLYPVDPHDGHDYTPIARTESFWRNAPLNLGRIKSEGCVADGLLSDYSKEKYIIPLAHTSNCYYFHRALETWLKPPDFPRAKEILVKIDRPDALFGMFLAEALDRKAEYYYRAENRYFDFSEMCMRESKNFWGEHTCKPSLKKEEYRAYLKQITEDAMDLGIRVFVFGQVKHQEESYTFPKIDNVIRDMRTYAKDHNIEILIGAQTGDVTKKSYLAHFDFIEGGIGLHVDGHVENGPCFSRYWKVPGDWCWPLMWHSDYTDRAENVFVYLDWNGQVGDDMHTFASMPATLRHETLRRLHMKFTQGDIGFFLPLLTPLPRNEDDCESPDKDFYIPTMQHGCADSDVINSILR